MLKLYFIQCNDGDDLDAFVRATSQEDAIMHWQAVFSGQVEDDEDLELNVIEVPVDSGIVGVIPWDTLTMEAIEI